MLYLYRASIPRYYYDKETRQCHGFTYGGCPGNTNNFETVEACEEACPGGYTCTYSYCVILYYLSWASLTKTGIDIYFASTGKRCFNISTILGQMDIMWKHVIILLQWRL